MSTHIPDTLVIFLVTDVRRTSNLTFLPSW